MECIEIDNILSTTVVYEDFFNYNEFFKTSRDTINKLKEIENKYANIDNKENMYLKNNDDLYLRKFIYKFKEYVSIKNILYPLENNDIHSIEVVDLSNNIEEKIMVIDINNNSGKVDISLNRKCKAIELRVKNKNNVFPLIDEIKIIESM